MKLFKNGMLNHTKLARYQWLVLSQMYKVDMLDKKAKYFRNLLYSLGNLIPTDDDRLVAIIEEGIRERKILGSMKRKLNHFKQLAAKGETLV